MSFAVVIPARYASTRLPGKPLLDIAGKPMLQHVWERALLSNAHRVIIATDDTRIRDRAEAFGAEVCMTRNDHPSGTDRLQEVVSQSGFKDDDIVVNVQGDEPLIPPAAIDQVAENLAARPDCGIATLSESIERRDELASPDAVKVVSAQDGTALYFSRAPIPWDRDGFREGISAPHGELWQRHIGIYAYRCGFLQQFVCWPAGQLEQLEKLEQLRAMENGVRIHVAAAVEPVPPGVDTPEDLRELQKRLSV